MEDEWLESAYEDRYGYPDLDAADEQEPYGFGMVGFDQEED